MRNVILISTGFFFLFFGTNALQQYLLLLFRADGRAELALITLVIIYGTFAVTGVFIAKIIPVLGGLKRSLIIGALTYVLFALSVASQSTPFIITIAFCMGIGAGLLWISSGQLILDSSSEHTARNLSFQMIALYAGNIFGVFAGGYLIEHVSPFLMYLVLATSMLLSIPFFLSVRPKREEVDIRPFKFGFLVDYRMLMLFPILFAAYFLQGQVFTAMNLVIVSALGLGFIPIIISLVKVSNIIGTIGSGSVSDWYNKSVVLTSLVVIALSGIALFTLSTTFRFMLGGALLLGFAMAAIYPVSLAWLKEKITKEEYLYALGIFHVYNNIGTVAAITANLWLPAGVSFLPGALALLAALPGIYFFHRIRPQ